MPVHSITVGRIFQNINNFFAASLPFICIFGFFAFIQPAIGYDYDIVNYAVIALLVLVAIVVVLLLGVAYIFPLARGCSTYFTAHRFLQRNLVQIHSNTYISSNRSFTRLLPVFYLPLALTTGFTASTPYGPYIATACGLIMALSVAFLFRPARRKLHAKMHNDTGSLADENTPFSVLSLRPFLADVANAAFDPNDESVDNTLLALFDQFGLVEIANPNQQRLTPGPRTVVPLDWQATVQSMVAKAKIVVLMLGKGTGLKWELSHIVNSASLSKTIFVVPGHMTLSDVVAALKDAGAKLPFDQIPPNARPIAVLATPTGLYIINSRNRGALPIRIALLLTSQILLKDAAPLHSSAFVVGSGKS